MDLRISQLPETSEVLGTDVLAIVNDGITKKVSVDQLMAQAVSKDYVDAQDALKVDKVDNERLINATEISKLEGIEVGAEVNVNADWNATTGDSLILNKPTIPSIEGLATETYVNNKVSSVLRYKGTVANYEALPTIDLVIGDTWNLLDTGMNYAYTGIIGALWDALGGTVAVGGFVPYIGAIANVDLGEYQLKAGQFEFDQTPTGVFNAGMVRWNDSDGTTERKLKGGNVTLQDGQETVKRVVNKTNANLLESQYRVVRIRTAAEGGSQGQRSAIVLAQANNNLNSNATLGVVTESILNNQEGFITLLGEVRQINTTGSLQSETWLDGDQLFLSATIAGGLTKVVPASPNYSIPVATVDYAHAINGKFSVNIGRRLALDTTLSGNNDTAPSVTAVRTYVSNTVAIIAASEGSGTGYVISSRNPLNYGSVGLGAIDLSTSNEASNVNGATGNFSFTTGTQTIASGLRSTAGGLFSTASGDNSNANGQVLFAKSFGEYVVGTRNTIYTPNSATTFHPLDRIFGVGNGASQNNESDALIILKNGLTTLPSVTNALISAEPTGKAVVTKEYLEEKYTQIGYTQVVNSGVQISTNSTTDVIANGLSVTTESAGNYKVDFNGRYNFLKGNVVTQCTLDLQALTLNLQNQVQTGVHTMTFINGEIITAGIYDVNGAAALSGNITLDAQNNPNALFVFRVVGAIDSQIGTTFTLANGAKAENIFWTATGAIGLTANNLAIGNFISLGAAVALGASSSLNGRFLSTGGAITVASSVQTKPNGISILPLGILENFVIFTASGNINNAALTTITGNIGTGAGIILYYTGTVRIGNDYSDGQQMGNTNIFSVYANNVLVPYSPRHRYADNYLEEIILSTVVNVQAGQTIDIRWRTDVGSIFLNDRILTVTKI